MLYLLLWAIPWEPSTILLDEYMDEMMLEAVPIYVTKYRKYVNGAGPVTTFPISHREELSVTR